MARVVDLIGRALGVVCAAGLASVWAFVLWVPSAGLTLENLNVVTALFLVVVSIVAGIAAVHGHAAVIAVVFLASFLPVGVSLLARDHWLQWVGWLDLGLLGSAVLIWLGKPRAAAS